MQQFLLNVITPPCLKEVELYVPEVMIAFNAIASLDESWDHRRNGKIMILDLNYEQIHNYADYELVFKTIRKFPGNYEGLSNIILILRH